MIKDFQSIMNNTTQHLFDAFNLINSPILLEIEYRFYYDEEGNIIGGTSTKKDHDSSISSIVVTKEQYESMGKYKVEKDKLVKIQKNYCLQPSLKGNKTIKYHSALILEPKESYLDTQHYE